MISVALFGKSYEREGSEEPRHASREIGCSGCGTVSRRGGNKLGFGVILVYHPVSGILEEKES